tara:strand:- start:356 stop:910 length:555 start_codon:yes stop_codon:yes gene_type:complete
MEHLILVKGLLKKITKNFLNEMGPLYNYTMVDFGTITSTEDTSLGDIHERKTCWARMRVHCEVTRGGGRFSSNPEVTVMWRTCICSKTNPCQAENDWTWEQTTAKNGKIILFGERCFMEHGNCPSKPCNQPLKKNLDGFWDPGGEGGLVSSYSSIDSLKDALEYGGNALYGEFEFDSPCSGGSK